MFLQVIICCIVILFVLFFYFKILINIVIYQQHILSKKVSTFYIFLPPKLFNVLQGLFYMFGF